MIYELTGASRSFAVEAEYCVGVRRAAPGAIMLRSEPRTDAGVRSHPRLQTRRLVLREIARMTLLIPHPHEEGVAEEWIASLRSSYEAGEWRAAQGSCRGRA
jgi:hypothetical protein